MTTAPKLVSPLSILLCVNASTSSLTSIVTGPTVVVFFIMLASAPATSTTTLFAQLPTAPQSCNTCHTNGPGTARNAFGLDVAAHISGTATTAVIDWSTLCALDSDSDGATNGSELGDPCCVWSDGLDAPSTTTGNPSDDTNRLGDACVDGGVAAVVDALWTCPAAWFGGNDGCDCGCGAVDDDCIDDSVQSCDANGCTPAGFIVDANNAVNCVDGPDGGVIVDGGASTVPDAWTCGATFYGANDGCDCGCGAVDADCVDASFSSCAANGCAAAGAGEVPTAVDPTQCGPPPPPPSSWNCAADWYGGADGCDCGCGAIDVDCADDAIDTCTSNACADSGQVPDPNDVTMCIDDDTGFFSCASAHDVEHATPTTTLIVLAALGAFTRRRRAIAVH